MQRFFCYFLTTIVFAIQTQLPLLANENSEKNNYIEIERKTITLNSRLTDLYNGYEYTINNIYDSSIQIENFTVWNNANGKVAFASVEKSKKQKISEIFETSKKLALPTLGTSIIITPFILPFSITKNNIGNKTAKKEAEKFDIMQYNKKFIINKNQKIKIRTLAIKNYIPVFKVMYKNPITDETMSLELK